MAGIKQRGAMAVAIFLEGLQALLQDAQAGDPGARALLAALRRALEGVEDFDSPLTVVRNN